MLYIQMMRVNDRAADYSNYVLDVALLGGGKCLSVVSAVHEPGATKATAVVDFFILSRYIETR